MALNKIYKAYKCLRGRENENMRKVIHDEANVNEAARIVIKMIFLKHLDEGHFSVTREAHLCVR